MDMMDNVMDNVMELAAANIDATRRNGTILFLNADCAVQSETFPSYLGNPFTGYAFAYGGQYGSTETTFIGTTDFVTTGPNPAYWFFGEFTYESFGGVCWRDKIREFHLCKCGLSLCCLSLNFSAVV